MDELFDLFTNCERPGEVLIVKCGSPEYAAVIACVPVASEDVANVQLPDASMQEPRDVPPSKILTCPDGVLPPGKFGCGATRPVVQRGVIVRPGAQNGDDACRSL